MWASKGDGGTPHVLVCQSMTLFEPEYSSTIDPCGPSESLSYCEGRWGPGLALSLRPGTQALFLQ